MGGTLRPPANAVGLESFTVTIPDAAAWAQAVERTGATVTGGIATASDPDGIQVVLARS